MEKVSIIIPTYKRAEFLERAIESCLNQTYKNIEILVIDDNDVDSDYAKNSKKIVEKYKKVKYIKNPKNLGGSLSRNEGIKHATGNFIAFLDDDDEFLPSKIEQQLNYYHQIKDENCCMIYSYSNHIYENGKIDIRKKDIEGNSIYDQLTDNIALTSTWMCPKDKLLAVDGFDNVKCCQEGTLLLKLLVKGYNIYRVPEVLTNFYVHPIDNASGITNISHNYIKNAKLYMNKCLLEADKLPKSKRKNVYLLKYYWIFNLYYIIKDKKGKKEYLNKILELHSINFITFKTIFKYLINN